MAMVDDRVIVDDDDDDESKTVTKFLLNTCRLLQPNKHQVEAAALCFLFATDELVPPTKVGEIHLIPLATGSSAEFYIQPMLSYIGDIDIMYHQGNILATPQGHPPPTGLPAEFHSCVKVYEIIDSEYPGYVYLVLSYLLTEDSDADKYNAIRYDRRNYAFHDLLNKDATYHTSEIHGPAVTSTVGETEVSIDAVPCVRCLSWPSQAADWPTRHRNNGWPDSATVNRVVSNGCDIVRVGHCLCRQDERTRKCQCRLSFSRAEIVLLNSWTPAQQIVYHMLRVFVKRERLTDITDSNERRVISNYHFKTLMMWSCELKPQSWWIHDVNLVRICVKLFHVFADWLENRKVCPHYFVNNCNLIDNTENLEIIASQLVSITESWLSTWFVNNYLRKCAHSCLNIVSRLFDDVSTRMKLQNAVSAVVDFRRDTALIDLWNVCVKAEYYVPLYLGLSECSLTIQSCGYWINDLVKIDSCLCDYLIAVVFLHVAKRITKHSFNEDLFDVLATTVGQSVGKRRYCHQLSSQLSLSKAVILMKVVANNSSSTVQQMEFELSKAYLYRALKCKDSDSDSIYCLANVYLAVLYYTSGQYQTAIDHCTLVTRSQNHSQCNSHVVQGDILPKVDNDIDTVLGLSVLYQYVRMAALNQQQTQYVVVFTTELFAYYLYIRCLSFMRCCQFAQMSSTDEVQRHTKYITDMDHLFIADVLLLRPIKMLSELKHMPEQRQKSTTNATELDTLELVQLLQQSAVEHLTTFRQLEVQRFSSIATIVATDFEALYAYKSGDYQRCLQLSTQNVCTLLNTEPLFVARLSTFLQFVQLMDDDIVSLTALTLIAYPKCRYASYNVGINQTTLSLYLMAQCQLKLHHSVTSLAQTLDYIELAKRRCPPVHWVLDRLTMKLTARKIKIYLKKIMQCRYVVRV